MNELYVISRDTIPPIREVEHEGVVHSLGELRDFRWVDELREFMPPASDFSVSWVYLAHGEVLAPHVHPIQSMMIFYAGSGEMLGDTRRPVAEGDVVVVPAGAAHGFIGGPDGLNGLSIQFGEGLYTVPERPRVHFTGSDETLGDVLAYNDARLREFTERPLFELLASGALRDPVKRETYLENVRIWLDGSRALLASIGAGCPEPLRRDHGAETAGRSSPDTILDAFMGWFAYKCCTLDEIERLAVAHLVLANATDAYRRRALPVVASYINDRDREIHECVDEPGAAMSGAFLRNESPKSYVRIKKLVGEAWDMIGAMSDRLAELTRAA